MPKPYHLLKYLPTGDLTVIAHRGASAYYPENTLVSFQAAIQMAADLIELDVRMTADGEVVVFHDEKLSRLTNGRGRIANYSLAELKKLDVGGWFDKRFQGEKIPTLKEALAVCKDKIALNIEIKDENAPKSHICGLVDKCLQLVEKSSMRAHVVFSSFHPLALSRIRQMDAKIQVSVLFEKKHYKTRLPSEIVASMEANSFNCSQRQLNKKRLADLRQHNIPVNIYTVNDEKSMKGLINSGVSGIFTNKPDVLRKIHDEIIKIQNKPLF